MSAADVVTQDLQVSRIPSATIHCASNKDSDQDHGRRLVMVTVEEMHSDAVTGILNQHAPVELKERIASDPLLWSRAGSTPYRANAP